LGIACSYSFCLSIEIILICDSNLKSKIADWTRNAIRFPNGQQAFGKMLNPKTVKVLAWVKAISTDHFKSDLDNWITFFYTPCI
jgi:hypothetical protein